MTVRITKPQAELLAALKAAGDRGVIKAQSYTPAVMLVTDGLARWAQKYFGGTGKLVVTDRGRQFGTGK